MTVTEMIVRVGRCQTRETLAAASAKLSYKEGLTVAEADFVSGCYWAQTHFDLYRAEVAKLERIDG